MCQHCKINEFAAQVNYEKWMDEREKVDQLNAELTVKDDELRQARQVVADVRALADQANDMEFHQLRGLLARISKRVGGVVPGGVAKAG